MVSLNAEILKGVVQVDDVDHKVPNVPIQNLYNPALSLKETFENFWLVGRYSFATNCQNVFSLGLNLVSKNIHQQAK